MAVRPTYPLLTLLALLALACTTPGDELLDNPSPDGTATPIASAPSSSPTPGQTTEDPAQPAHLRKFTLKTRKGQKWELESEKGVWYDDNAKAHVEDVTWYLVGEDDEKDVKVESPEAEVDMDSEIVTFTGRVLATRLGFDETLRVQRLVYNGKTRRFYGSEGVVWQRDTAQLSGETLTATAELDKVLLKGRVKGKTQGGLPDFGESPGAGSEQRTQ